MATQARHLILQNKTLLGIASKLEEKIRKIIEKTNSMLKYLKVFYVHI